MLHLKCKGQEMKIDVDERIADKYINANKVHFEFCERWAGMIITAQFTQKQDGVDKTYDVVVDELTNMVTMPNEIVAGEVHISAFGVDPVTGVRITSIPVKKTIDKSGFVGDGETPVPPTPDLYAQLLEQFGNGVPPSTGANKQLVTDKSGAIAWENLRVMAGTNHGSVRTSAAAAEQILGYKLGNAAFAANMETEASGQAAFAAGFGTEAIGKNSFAEGQHTIANGENQHVQGKFNVKDTENKYAHIVGNGMTSAKRANAHTLDWDGNAWFKGGVYVGGDDQSKGEKLVTKSELDAAVAAGGGGSSGGGVTYVNFSGSLDDGYTADKTLEEITALYENGASIWARQEMDGVVLIAPLTMFMPGALVVFAIYNGEQYRQYGVTINGAIIQ